jgi:hypothetical protein
MLGLDAAGKTSEFLSCPVQSGFAILGGLDIMESVWSIRSWIALRDGCDHGNRAGFERAIPIYIDPTSSICPPPIPLPSPIFCCYQNKAKLTLSDIV